MDLEISNLKENINNDSFSKELKNHNCIYSVDRFEGEFAVCENLQTGEMINIKKSLLPENIKEGFIIRYSNGKYNLDDKLTKKRQSQVETIVNNLFKKK